MLITTKVCFSVSNLQPFKINLTGFAPGFLYMSILYHKTQAALKKSLDSEH